MALTIVAAFIAGFFVGNGLPYYAAGSTGEGQNPSPFPDKPVANVVVGWIAMILGAASFTFTNLIAHPRAAFASAAAGVLVVGLIHARLWRRNPWRKN
jgi:hypothetical protein